MPKDAKGHGSNPRGARETDKRLKLGASKGGLTLGERYQATMDKRNKTGVYADNEKAAAALASGPKSAPAPVHDAMRYAPDHSDSNAYQHEYNPESVNHAIKNSGRFGGGKIGGREARMIHAILKGHGK